MKERCTKCGRERPDYITDARCREGGYCDWIARGKSKPKHNVFVLLPSARGVHPDTMWNVFDLRTELEKAGHSLSGSTIHRWPLDLARNELVTTLLTTNCDLALLLDDDVQLDRDWIVRMVECVGDWDPSLPDGGIHVLSAPCRMRSEGHLFNVIPVGAPFQHGALRVAQCAWTGLGAVIVARGVFEKLLELGKAETACPTCGKLPSVYRSVVYPNKISRNLFGSRLDPAGTFDVSAQAGEQVLSLDDKAFSRHLHEAGFKIHAAIDVPTCHDGLKGCFGEELEKIERQRAAAMAMTSRPGLLGPNGERL